MGQKKTGTDADGSGFEAEPEACLSLSVAQGTTLVALTATIGHATPPPPLVPADPPIVQPVAHYVYFHRDIHGTVFYIGMGTGRRAWSKDRHLVWHRYVDQQSSGRYSVEIYRDGLSQQDAEILENEFVAAYGRQLVNWVNGQRAVDYEKLDVFHKLRNANRARIQDAKALEKVNPEESVRRYREAIRYMAEYARMQTESGLIAELLGPPCWDDSEALDRLTLVLSRLGRYDELIRDAEAYFEFYPEAKERCAKGRRVQARMAKARVKRG